MIPLDNQVFNGRVIHVLPLTLAGSVVLASVSFRFVERPITTWAHRRRTPRPAPQPEPDEVPVPTG